MCDDGPSVPPTVRCSRLQTFPACIPPRPHTSQVVLTLALPSSRPLVFIINWFAYCAQDRPVVDELAQNAVKRGGIRCPIYKRMRVDVH